MFENRPKILEALKAGFWGKEILVVGDLMLDRYIWGDVSRISPEAPVPVVRVDHETERCGGAANVALNLAGLGFSPRLVGFVGGGCSTTTGSQGFFPRGKGSAPVSSSGDPAAVRLAELLGQAGVNSESMIILADRPTTTKTRIIGGHQQMLRLDHEKHLPIAGKEAEALLPAVEDLLATVHEILKNRPAAVILSDYDKGVLQEEVCRKVISQAKKQSIPVFVDPKGVDYSKYTGAVALSPNRRELAEATRFSARQLDDLLDAGVSLTRQLDLDFLAVTLSEQGVALVSDGQVRIIPSLAREVYDVSGAGDTVIATLTAGIVAGLSRLDALHFANLAAGVVVGKVGTVPIKGHELMKALSVEESMGGCDDCGGISEKICTMETLQARVAAWREKGESIVFTNGCFDILHIGHVTYLDKARRFGDRLIVGLNTDRSVRTLKGSLRPVTAEGERAQILAALASVDAVVLFDEDTPLSLINIVRPEILVKGADYAEDQVVGAEAVKSWGGHVKLIPLVAGQSTTEIIRHINKIN